MSLSKPHDTIFKGTFSGPEASQALVSPSLSPTVVQGIDWSSMSAVQADIVAPKGEKLYCDLVFEAPIHSSGSEQSVLLHLHFEHQSQVDQGMIYRSLAYAGTLSYKLWLDRRKKGKARTRPAILSVVVSNAEKPWDAPTQLDQTYAFEGELAEELRPLLTQHNYLVIDLCRLSNEQIRMRASEAYQGLVLLMMRSARSPEALEILLENKQLVEETARGSDGKEHFDRLTCYVANVNPDPAINEKTVNEALGKAGPVSHEVSSSNWADIEADLIARGEARGEARGKAEGARLMLLETLSMQLEERFGRLSAADRSRIEEASTDQLKAWAREFVRVDSVQELLGER